MKNQILFSLLFLLPLCSNAQTTSPDSISRTVTVESVYNPVLVSAEKRLFLPEDQQVEIEKSAAVYADNVQNISSFSRTPLFAKGVQLEEAKNYPGYLRLGVGNRWNVDALAALRHNLGKSNVVDLWMSHDGHKGNIPYEDTKWKSMLYNLETGASFTHKGKTGPMVKAELDAALHTYNYIVTNSQQAVVDRQKARNLGGALTIAGEWKDFTPERDANYFGAVDFHQWHQGSWMAADESVNEDHLSIDFGGKMDTGSRSAASLGVASDVMFYNNQGGYADYFSFAVNPSWKVERSAWSFKAGLHVDFQTDEMRPAQVAPDFRFSIKPFDFLRVNLSADGGRTVRSFKELYAISPWWGGEKQLRQSFDLLNSRLQLDARIIDGVHVGAWGGYRIVKDGVFATTLKTNGLLYTGLLNQDATVWNMGANAVASWKDVVTLTASVDYFSWRSEASVLEFAPEEDLKLNACTRIMDKLYADATLRYLRFVSVDGVRQPSVADLGLGARYTVLDNVSAFAKIENLLNRYSGLTPVYPQQGIHMLIGASLKF